MTSLPPASEESHYAGATLAVEAVRKSGVYLVVTPDKAVALASKADDQGAGTALRPLIGGRSPAAGWKSRASLADKACLRLGWATL